MPHATLLVITGASGVGKTTLVLGLEARELPGIRCHYFDSIGVPSADEMIRHYGGAEEWQRGMTTRWIQRLAAETAPGTLSVLDGQVRPSVVRAALALAPPRLPPPRSSSWTAPTPCERPACGRRGAGRNSPHPR